MSDRRDVWSKKLAIFADCKRKFNLLKNSIIHIFFNFNIFETLLVANFLEVLRYALRNVYKST